MYTLLLLFASILQDQKLYVFYSDGCQPCAQYWPQVQAIIPQLTEKRILVYHINTANYSKTAAKYNITAVPTTILLRDGKVVDGFEGVKQSNQLLEWIDK